MKMPTCSPCSSGSPQKTGSLRALEDVVGDRDRLLRGVRALQRAAELEQVQAQVDRRPVEHDRRDHLVRARGRLEQPGDPRPEPADDAASHDRRHDMQQGGQAVQRGADVDGGEAADEVLTLAADVEQAGAERERDGEAGEDQGCRDDQRLLQVQPGDQAVLARDPGEQPVQPRALEDRPVGADRVGAGGEHDEAADRERHQRGDHRDQDAAAAQVAGERRADRQGAGSLATRRGTGHARTVPPSIATPISSSVTSGESSATMRPS